VKVPTVTRVYQNHHLDSKRWEGYQPRNGDVIVTTSYKAGTTFAQTILMSLIHGSVDLVELERISPWIDLRHGPVPLEDIYASLEAQSLRRFLKSHLALDGLRYYENVKYLIVARDPRDVFMSFAHHYENYTEFAYATFNDGRQVSDPLPRYEKDVQMLWKNWITRGWFDWESEGYPFWGNMHHIQTYWDYRHLPNFHFLHYADMLTDLKGTIRRIASHIDHAVTEEEVDRTASEVNFSNMKKKAVEMDENPLEGKPQFFTGGNASFIFKGTNGRWRDVLSDEDLDLYEAAKERVLSPDCAQWLEQGGQV